jgi:hypothetical protein
VDDALARWLALREPIDFASRSEWLTRLVAERLKAHDPLDAVDLATGTGSNIRYLATRLTASHQRWLALDQSQLLLDLVPARVAAAGTARDRRLEISTRQTDLGKLVDLSLFTSRQLVTASALLDLVSESWLRSLATACRDAGVEAALFTITYNGESACSPADPDDRVILELFNQHQHRDKGLGGPAAGPDGTNAAARAFRDAGYRVETERSDWNIAAVEKDLQRELIDGWTFAAGETDPSAANMIDAWRTRRLEHVDTGRSHLVVGHYDLAAIRT